MCPPICYTFASTYETNSGSAAGHVFIILLKIIKEEINRKSTGNRPEIDRKSTGNQALEGNQRIPLPSLCCLKYISLSEIIN
jgi:hypothetical protein